jgi:hypothetical protein
VHRMSGERFEGDRPDELRRRRRHHHIHPGSRLGQQSRQPSRFVAGDSSRDAQEDAGTVVGTN